MCQYDLLKVFDSDSSTKTDACSVDTDKDGIPDGAEDTNSNGRVDVGELNPQNPNDGTGPAQNACALSNLKPISFHSDGTADVQVALIPAFADVSYVKDGNGKERGIMFYDASHQVAGFVVSLTPRGSDVLAEETLTRADFAKEGTVSGALTQTFSSWDGFSNALRASYDLASSQDLKPLTNSLLQRVAGNMSQGLLSGQAAVSGATKVYAEIVHRTATRAVILVALTPATLMSGNQEFFLSDVAGGSALAQHGDFAGPQCEVFLTEGNSKVDFIWVVDNSASMGNYQGSIGNVGNLFPQELGNAGLDWRVAGIATDGANSTLFVNQISSKFFTNFGTKGLHTELPLHHAKEKVKAMLPKASSDPLRIRTDADLHVILFGDADDSTMGTSVADFISFFKNYDGNGSEAMVHGIVCPADQTCIEWNDPSMRRNIPVIAGTGGVLGDINAAANPNDPATANTLKAILNAAIVSTGKQLSKPPISATLKVSIESGQTVGPCNTADVPRDRINGFDFDAATRRIVFFGNCRPSGVGKKVAVSYRFWNENSPFPGGEPCNNQCVEPKVCSPVSQQCVCRPDCGGCPESLYCDVQACQCVGVQ